MVLCPIAIASGCKKCPAVSFCPLKSVIGDWVEPSNEQTKQESDKAEGEAKPKGNQSG